MTPQVPATTKEFRWRAGDGTEFPAMQWGDPENAGAVILCIHGLGGGPGDFISFGEAMVPRGFVSYAVTVRGQGLDPDQRRRGFHFEPDEIAGDLLAFARTIHQPGKPIFYCGESLGAMVLADAFCRDLELPEPAGLIFSAPVVALARETPRPVRLALRLLATLCPRGRLKPSWFVTGNGQPPKTSRDEAWVEIQRRGPQHVPAFSFGVLDRIGRLMERMTPCARRVTAPCLVLAAGRDIYIRTPQVRAWFDEIGSADKTFLEFPESYHVLWNDYDRESVLAAIAGWLDDHRQQPSC